jgi:hypothetical protein
MLLNVILDLILDHSSFCFVKHPNPFYIEKQKRKACVGPPFDYYFFENLSLTFDATRDPTFNTMSVPMMMTTFCAIVMPMLVSEFSDTISPLVGVSLYEMFFLRKRKIIRRGYN